MANADKCFLNIPFKEYLKTYDPEDPESRKLAADREFENYKAIERRINDPDCGGGCPCYRAWVDSGSTNLSLVADTVVSAGADMDTIIESEGTFGISGQAVTGPDGLYWYSVSARFTDGASGTDAVMAGVQIDVAASSYVPDGFDVYVTLSGFTTLPFRPTYVLSRTTAGTRDMVASCSAYLWRMCSCTPTPGGGGG